MPYQTDRHRQIVEYWLEGMAQNAIAQLFDIKSVRGILMRYCDRDTVITRDGRGYWYRLARRLHPDAPLSDKDQWQLWPTQADPDDDEESLAARKVLELVDALNDAIADLENRSREFTRRHSYPHRVVLNTEGGRLYAAIIPVSDD